MDSGLRDGDYMNKENLAWCAGIFEGEGHARVQIIDNHIYAHIEIDNTDISILERFKKVVGIGSVLPHSPKRKDGWNRKPQFRYSVTCKNAYHVAKLLLPYVISNHKREQLFKILNQQKV